jgi:hypothetical protein
MGTLEIIIERKDRPRTVYQGEAEWFTDQVAMVLLEGPAVEGYDPANAMSLEFHAAICRGHCWNAGLETTEKWSGEFVGGRER